MLFNHLCFEIANTLSFFYCTLLSVRTKVAETGLIFNTLNTENHFFSAHP